MTFTLDLFIRAIGLAFILEGLLWAIFPSAMRSAMRELVRRPPNSLQSMGLGGIGIGLLIIFLAHTFL